MSPIRLFIDEDSMDQRLVAALRARGVDVTTVGEVSMIIGFRDAEQLALATSQGRVLYTFNVGDFCRLHRFCLDQGRSHAGIIISSQDYSVSRQVKRVLALMADHSAKDMVNHLSFLSHCAAG